MSAPNDSMRCQDVRRQLSLLQDGELAPERQAWLIAHLEACPECRAVYAQLQAAWAALSGLAAPRTGREFVATVLMSTEGRSFLDRLRVLAPSPVRFVPAPVALALTLLVGLVTGGILGNVAPHAPAAQPVVEAAAASTLDALNAFAAAPRGSLAQGYMQLAGLEER